MIPPTELQFGLIDVENEDVIEELSPGINFDASITIDETRGVDAGTDDILVGLGTAVSNILSTGDPEHVVTLSYAFGEGSVIYSTIPLDFYLAGSGSVPAFADVYAPNVVNYAASLTGDAGPLQVGYYDMSDEQGNADQVASIIAAGHIPVLITDLSPAELASIDVLIVQNPSNGSYGGEYLTNLANVNAAVGNGLVMVLHDRFVDDAETILPGGAAFEILRDFTDDADIDILDPTSVLIIGPGGTITDATLDFGTSSSHGFVEFDSTGAGEPLPPALAGLGVDFIQVGLSNAAFSFGPEIDPTTLALTTAGGAAFSGQDSGLDTTDGNSIFLFSDPANPTQVLGVEGATPGAAAAAFAGGTGTVLAIFLDPATSELWVGQTEAIEHPDPTSNNEAVSISGLIFLSAADTAGNVGTSTNAMTVTILDDGPMIELKPEGGEGGEGGEGPPMVFEKHLNIFKKPQLLDKNFDGGEYPEFFFPTAEVGLNFDFGTDGPADEGMGFTIALASATDGDDGGPLPTGLRTSQDDLPVNTSYDAENKVLIGFTGADPSDMDSWVFTLELTDFMDNSMATALFTLYQAIEHPDINETQFDDPINLNFTITATDGDEDTASVDVVFQVKDDGPGGRFGLEVGTAIADEDGLVPDGDTNGFNDPNADGDNNILTGSGFLGIFGGDFGADGPGANSGLSFAPQAAPAGLTSRGDAVSYSVSADGQVLTATAGGRTVFTVTLDLDNSEYDLVLSDVIDHIGGFEDGRVNFDLRFVDGDGDFFTREEALSIVIRDAQPTAEDDTDTALEGGPDIMGNVITGEEFEGGEAPVNPAEADVPGADGAARIVSVQHGPGPDNVFDRSSPGYDSETGTLTIPTFLGGTLVITIDSDGTDPLGKYTYTPPEGLPGEGPGNFSEEFEYILEDGDTDTDPATLTINLTPTDPAFGTVEGNVCLHEDNDANQHINGQAEADQTVPIGPADVFTPNDNEVIEGATLNFAAGVAVMLGGAALTSGAALTAPQLAAWLGGADIEVTVPGDSDADITIGFTLNIVDPDSGATNTVSGDFDILVDAVADKPTVEVLVDAGLDNQIAANENLTVTVNAQFFDLDGSESFTVAVTIPDGFDIGLPVAAGGVVVGQTITWDLAVGDLNPDGTFSADVDVTAPAVLNDPAFDFDATATAVEGATVANNGAGGDQEKEDGNNTATDEDQQTVPRVGEGVLIVGENVDDQVGQQTPHRVEKPSDAPGPIIGEGGSDALIGGRGRQRCRRKVGQYRARARYIRQYGGLDHLRWRIRDAYQRLGQVGRGAGRRHRGLRGRGRRPALDYLQHLLRKREDLQADRGRCGRSCRGPGCQGLCPGPRRRGDPGCHGRHQLRGWDSGGAELLQRDRCHTG